MINRFKLFIFSVIAVANVSLSIAQNNTDVKFSEGSFFYPDKSGG